MAIVVDLQLGRSLAAVGPHNAVVELLDEARRGARHRWQVQKLVRARAGLGP